MKDQLISFETAKSAKEKGLLNPTLYFYGEDGKNKGNAVTGGSGDLYAHWDRYREMPELIRN